ncbi:MAG: hypothetical protein D6773_05335, partial [Alphaproteobacteria bacterium]
PLTVLEASAMGCVPCVARVGGIPKLGLPERLLFPAGDHVGCARALSAAMEAVGDAGLRRHLRTHIAQRHDIRCTSRKYSALYADLAGKRTLEIEHFGA